MLKVTNNNVRLCVQDLIEFKNSTGSLYGKWETPTLYVVYSYGPHFPLFLRDSKVSWSWAENSNNYSPTTSKHYTQAHPQCETVKSTTAELQAYIAKCKSEWGV